MEQKVMDLLREQFDPSTKEFVADSGQIMKIVTAALPELGKRQKGSIMGFAVATIKEIQQDPTVLDTKLFDECTVLESFKPYFINTYNVASVSVTLDNSSPIAKPGRPEIQIGTE
eukprot:gnl/Chilomastix_caulleri/1368.p1 GENE.gnl/Chilomastix_caulleri/1368~~gnl/Chilomastix_caulleri/1368.p1  ORF type:complete len:115 (+),score=44.15 gnl/Chilomastix_caulleri/1368:697-1041(+)